eukprot:TRINITY_DN8123_c1_g1_i6.p2 TRINITY_DN8123_c1_g1~~TRINITY_DN8123_c1_g1_i6.p2  ORF type:complete len:192 (-),score=9.33 TRINITY_DN8123_c1_g1_i6:286-861(-)
MQSILQRMRLIATQYLIINVIIEMLCITLTKLLKVVKELATQLGRDYVPKVRVSGIKLLLVSIGTVETGQNFAKRTQFPDDLLLADPDNCTYKALGLYSGLQPTLFNIATPISIGKRFMKDGAKDMVQALGKWKPYQTPKGGQWKYQGGMFVFDGYTCVYGHYDQATGAHPDLEEVFCLVSQQVDKRLSRQ